MTDTSISVEHLSKHFATVTAVDDVSFDIEHGATYALLGANGAGKTTTLAMLLGLLLPSAGNIRILGVDMLRDRYQVLHRMNYSSPYVDLPQRLTVRENLTVYARLYGVRKVKERLSQLFEELEIGDFAQRRYRSLSAGQRTRVALAKALLNKPEVLLLDEPTASLDPDSADHLRTYLENYQHRSGATILLASHNMPEVERLCDHVLIMRRGKIVDSGAPEQLVARYGRRNMEEVFLDVARRQEAAA
jgi:ABC-2 type transport system ATP-binding protein